MYHTIYVTTNKINGKKYIGKHQTSDLNDNYLGSGILLKQAIKKYGKKNFEKEILFVFDNESEMNDKEKELITESVILCDDYYNISFGGQGGKILNDESLLLVHQKIKITHNSNDLKRKKSEAAIEGHKNKTIGMYGKKHTEETKRKQRLSRIEWQKNNIHPAIGRIVTEETREKLRIANTGDKNPAFGKKYTDEERQKISDMTSGEKNGMYGKKHSPETKEKIRQKALSRKRKNDDI